MRRARRDVLIISLALSPPDDHHPNDDGAPRSETRTSGLITVYDERGRQLQISRAEWARSVLPASLKAAWNLPRQLYNLIAGALTDELAEHVLQAAERLVAIEPDAERSMVILAVVQMKTGNLQAAEATLLRFMESHGETGFALTNLAKVRSAQGHAAEACSLLAHSIEVDPNQDNGLLWWLALQRDEGGERAVEEALRTAALHPRAWRPQLWLARRCLERKELTAAFSLYDVVLARAADEPDVLMMISGDLGNAGQLEAIARLVGPRWDAARHGHMAGLNLIEALKRQRRFEEAQDVLRRLKELRSPPLAERLANVEKSLAEARLPSAAQAEPPPVQLILLEKPIWTRGLFEPDWLLPRRSRVAPVVTVFALSNGTLTGAEPRSTMPDPASRFARALALYLGERLTFDLDLEARTILFAVKGGIAIFGGASPIAQLAPAATVGGRRCLGLSGIVVPGKIVLELWDAESQSSETIDVPGSVDDVGAWIRRVESLAVSRVQARTGAPRAIPEPLGARAPDELLPRYASAIEQLVYQLLVAWEIAPASSLWNERGMFETYVSLAECGGELATRARLLTACGVLAATQYASAVVSPYQGVVRGWLQSAGSSDPLSRLAPAIFLKLKAWDAYDASLEKATLGATPEYAAWLDRVRAERKRVTPS